MAEITRTLAVFSLVLALPVPVFGQLEEDPFDAWFDLEPPLSTVTTVALDAGHGGTDAGVSSADGMIEKNLTLEIAREAARRIEDSLGVRVVLTRDADQDLSLTARVAAANAARADLLVSLHVGQSTSEDVRGIAVYYHSPDSRGRAIRKTKSTGLEAISWNDASRPHVPKSAQLAGVLAAALTDASELPLHGVRAAPIAPLVGATMPAVLIEVGFFSNSQDATALADEKIRVLLADAIRQAILDYDEAAARR